MGNPQYIQDAVDNFEDLYGEELTDKQRQNLIEACEYGEVSLGMDVDDATEALMAWGDYTGDMDRALDNAGDLKTLLDNFDRDTDDLDEYLTDMYLEDIGVGVEDLGMFVALFTDFEKYKRYLEFEGWVFAPSSDDTTIFVFRA